MKKYTICIIAAATALTGIMQSAQAGDKERYLIGGLLGGWILNEVTDRSSSVEVYHERRSCPPVVVERHHYRHSPPRRPSGRYEIRRIRVWVPGRYIRVEKRCGRVEHRWVSGHYDIRTEKVWVPYGRSSSRGHGRRW